MIIKYYGTDSILRILEGVSDVSVSMVAHRSDQELGEQDKPCVYSDVSFEDEAHIPYRGWVGMNGNNGTYKSYIPIFFKDKEGCNKALSVYGKAYICSDDGKTIEKVECFE